MKKDKFKMIGGLFGFLAMGTLLVALVLRAGFFLSDSPAVSQVFQSPIQTPPRATPTPPQGTPASSLDRFVFGAPEVVLTHPSAIGIADWLPNGQDVLLTLGRPDTITETVEIFNLWSHERQMCGERPSTDVKPIWLNISKKVAYTAFSDQGYDLWINECGAAQAQQLFARNVDIALGGRNNRVLAIKRREKQAVLMDNAEQSTNASLINLEALGFNFDNQFVRLYLEWSPIGSDVAIFDDKQFVLINVDTGNVRPINLGQKGSKQEVIMASVVLSTPVGVQMVAI
jgi:hypothetical protein